MNYITWDSILDTVNANCDIKIMRGGHQYHGGLQIPNRHPISINEVEFNYLRSFIVENNLKSGFELATGIGISTLAAALAMKETNGYLISFDSYIEEFTNQDSPTNTDPTRPIYKDSQGFKLASRMLELYDCAEFASLQCGWSPTDTIAYLQTNNVSLDYVFLDCPKDMVDFRRDMGSLKPFLKDKFVIFVHDTHCYNWNEFHNYVVELLGVVPIRITEYFNGTPYYQNKHFPLVKISNL